MCSKKLGRQNEVVSLYRVHSLFGRTKAFVLSRIRLRKLACTRYRDTTDFRFGPFHMSSGFARPFQVEYSRTAERHIVKLKLRPDIKKEDLRVRLQEGGVLEIEWPRKTPGEDIPVE